jgi:hypothetical protein
MRRNFNKVLKTLTNKLSSVLSYINLELCIVLYELVVNSS